MQELEISPCQIARLVLGYLKAENCKAACEEFLKCSKHLKEYKGKIITRVDHKTLVDYLTEYSQLNILIQERIEETDFYNEQHSRATLLEQLNYLLDCQGGNIRASTPINKKLTLSDVAVNTEFGDVDEERYGVNATSLDALPGNKNTNDKDESITKEEETSCIDFEVLTQTLLEHHDLHEKLADTINVVRNTPAKQKITPATDKNNTTAQDIETAIKTIVQKTTSDPFFDKLVKEVIGEDEESNDTGQVEISDKPNELETVFTANQDATKQHNNSLDHYLKFHNTSNLNPTVSLANQNSLMVNSNSVLMLQTAPAVAAIDFSTPYYVINSTPAQPICSAGSVLNEQDIMSMPVVVCDNKQEQRGLSQLIVSTDGSQSLAPTYVMNLPSNPPVSQSDIPVSTAQVSQNEEQKPGKRARRKKIVSKFISGTVKSRRILPKNISFEIKRQIQRKIPKIETPLNEKSGVSKVVTTPRSGSHVRALDFSTPQKPFDNPIIKPVTEINKPQTKKTSWDSDLRGMIEAQDKPTAEIVKKKSPKKKRNKNVKKTLNTTQEQANLIEKALFGTSPMKKTKRPNSVKKKVVTNQQKPTNDATIVKQDDDARKKQQQQNNSPIDKLIMSPSKLNASKRSLIDLSETPQKQIEIAALKRSAVKRNIASTLKTPMKIDECPKTPGFFSPISNSDTPFTKVLKEQLDGIDIATIPTPSFPVTPSFPFTPSVDESRYPNRPTDYSSSSSYYHPSDNENNRSLEHLIGESTIDAKCELPTVQTNQTVPLEKQIQVLNEIRIPPSEAVVNKMKTLSRNVIGRKNLKLVEAARASDSSSSSSSSSSCSSSVCDSDSGDECNKSCLVGNQTVISNEVTAQRYSLRLRNNAGKKGDVTPVVKSNTETITTILKSVDVKATLSDVKQVKSHDEILLEMEEKRKKTIEKLESDQLIKPKRIANRKQSTKSTVAQKCKPRTNPIKQGEPKRNEHLELFELPATIDKTRTLSPSSLDAKIGETKQKNSVDNFVTSTPTNEKTKANETEAFTSTPNVRNNVTKTNEKSPSLKKEKMIEMSSIINDGTRKRSLSVIKTDDTKLFDKIAPSVVCKNDETKINETLNKQSPSATTEKNIEAELGLELSTSSTTDEQSKISEETKEQSSSVDITDEKPKIVEMKLIEVLALKPENNNTTELFKNTAHFANDRTGKTLPFVDTGPTASGKTKTNEKTIKRSPSSITINKKIKLNEKAKLRSLSLSTVNEKTRERSLPVRTINENTNKQCTSVDGPNKKTETIAVELLDNPASVANITTEKTKIVDNNVTPSVSSITNETELLENLTSSTVGNDDTKTLGRESFEYFEIVVSTVTADATNETAKTSGSELIANLTPSEADVTNDKEKTSVDTESRAENKKETPTKTNERRRNKEWNKQSTNEITKIKKPSPSIDTTKAKEQKRKRSPSVGKRNERVENVTPTTSDEKTKKIETASLPNINTEELKTSEKRKKQEPSMGPMFEKRKPSERIRKRLLTKNIKHENSKTKERVKKQSPLVVDKNAEKLVNDLKERGIHLVHNNKLSPQKQETETGIETKIETKDDECTEGLTEENRDGETQEGTVEIEFCKCLFDKETLSLVYDPSNKPNKKLTDYDFTLLNKEMNATVYLAEFDAEVQKVMTCTPFDLILDIPSKSDIVVSKSARHARKDPTKLNPLDMLNKQISDEQNVQNNASPLEGLYYDEKNSYVAERQKTNRNELDNKKHTKKSEHRHAKHKRARSLSNLHEKETKKEKDRAKDETVSIKNRRSSEPKPFVTSQNEELNIANGVVMINLNPSEGCADDIEDELMNYASVGTPEKCLKKRKADEKVEGEHVEKKIKPECKQLLREMDVDSFLKQLHGDA